MSAAPDTILAVGSSKYSSNLDAEIARTLMRQEPVLLTAAELEFDRNPPHQFDQPRRVWAWIRYPAQACLVQAMAYEWSRTAVQIEFCEPHIRIWRKGWVWLNSVTPASLDDA
ncbi:hypothetical protein GCM10009582_34900 [Arthrobacter flavus]